MTKEEIVNAIADVNEQMEELRKVYEPYVGMQFDELSNEDQERIRKILGSYSTANKCKS